MRRTIAMFLAFAAVTLAFQTAVAQTVTRPNRGAMRSLRDRATSGLRGNGRDATMTTPSAAALGGANGAAAGGAEAEGGQEIALNFNQAPIDHVLEFYGHIVGKTVLKDPQVPSTTIIFKSEKGQKLTQEEQVEALEVLLEMYGVHLEPYGEKFIRAVPRKEARKEGIPLIMDTNAALGEKGKVISMMIQFKNIGTEEAQKALEGFKSASGILLVFERTNSILVTDTEQNIKRMVEIAKTIDVATPVTEQVEYIQIKYANANEVKQVIDAIVQESQKEQEANGKKVNTPAQPALNQPRQIGSLLRGRNQQNNQPQTPVNNESLVLSVSDADRGMIRGKVVTIADERSNKILLITSAANMKFFKEVIAALDVETTPDTLVKVYRLKYAEAEDVSDMINDLIGNSVSGKSNSKGNQNQNAAKGTSGNVTRGNTAQQAKKSVNQRSGEAKAGELNKENTTVLADKRINGIVVMTQKDLVPTIEQIIESMDVKLSQVLIETVIIEVGLGDGIETGMDWVQHGRQQVQTAASVGQKLGADGSLVPATGYRTARTITKTKNGADVSTSSSILDALVPEGYSAKTTKTTTDEEGNTWTETIEDSASELVGTASKISTDGLLNYFTAGSATAIAGGQGGQMAYNISKGVTSNIFGKALNFVFTSDELGLTAILQANKNDSRSKYVASPIIMTLDNKEATINATEMRYLLKGFTSSGNSYSTIAVPDYEQKELGIEIKVTPKINPNGTVMLTCEEKYTQLGAEQSIQFSTGTGGDGGLKSFPVPTTITREMSSDVILENNQTVVFGGLTQNNVSESETGIPILKDIPWIGKWLFGTVSRQEARTELLIFMTPYVLTDAEAAQAEAIRRKKVMSDPRPWDDNGWSQSPIADPVSKKEQMRRLKDEWKKQDEERKTKLAIEQAKIERAKELEKMSEEERKLWLEMHKEELDKEKREELEKKMLDSESQEELKKLADEIKRKKIKDADKKIEELEKDTDFKNEHDKAIEEQKKSMEKKANDKIAEMEKKLVVPETPAKVQVQKKEPEVASAVKPEKNKAEEVKLSVKPPEQASTNAVKTVGK